MLKRKDNISQLYQSLKEAKDRLQNEELSKNQYHNVLDFLKRIKRKAHKAHRKYDKNH